MLVGIVRRLHRQIVLGHLLPQWYELRHVHGLAVYGGVDDYPPQFQVLDRPIGFLHGLIYVVHGQDSHPARKAIGITGHDGGRLVIGDPAQLR